MYRTQVLTCHPGKRDEMLMALKQGLTSKPTGMLDMEFQADDTDELTLVVVQTWESKEVSLAFQASLPPEKKAFFGTLVASKAEAWHRESVQF